MILVYIFWVLEFAFQNQIGYEFLGSKLVERLRYIKPVSYLYIKLSSESSPLGSTYLKSTY